MILEYFNLLLTTYFKDRKMIYIVFLCSNVLFKVDIQTFLTFVEQYKTEN